MAKNETILSYDEMQERTKQYYAGLGIELNDDNLSLGVQSLTMPSYANEYNQTHLEKINDHRSLATLGDACWGVFILVTAFSPTVTKGQLSNDIKNKVCSNEEMNKLANKFVPQKNCFTQQAK